MRVSRAMSSPAVTVTPETSVKRAAELMASHGFTVLPVVNGDLELVGIVSEGDLVSDRFPGSPRCAPPEERGELSHRGGDPGPRVANVMTKEVITTTCSEQVRDLIARMRAARVRAVPVRDEDMVVGVVTYRDLVRALVRADERIATDVRRRLTMCFGPGHFVTTVQDGEVVLVDRMSRPEEWHTARVLAEQVPGVVKARVVNESPAEEQ